jgi:TNF receptor-associated factor 2/TNF receptor-associated factor 3
MADKGWGELVLRDGSFGGETEENDGALSSGPSWCEYDEPKGQEISFKRDFKGGVSLERASESGEVPKKEWARKSSKAVTTGKPERPSGFSIEIFEGSKQLILRLLCFCCNLVLKDPVQTEEGVRLCSDCADYIIKLPNHTCPQCQITIQKGGVIPDFAGRKEVCRLNVRCINKAIGCAWRGILGTLQEHLKACDYKSEPCELCSDLVVAKFMGEHLKKKCTHREVQCEYCTITLKFYELETHQNRDCPDFPISCPACQIEVTRATLPEHKANECKFMECIICKEQVLRSDYKKHIKQNAHSHFVDLSEMFFAMKKEFDKLKESKEKSTNEESTSSPLKQPQNSSILFATVQALEEKLESFQAQLERADRFEMLFKEEVGKNALLGERIAKLELQQQSLLPAVYNRSKGPLAGIVDHDGTTRYANYPALKGPESSTLSLSSGLSSFDSFEQRLTELEYEVKKLSAGGVNADKRIVELENAFRELKQSSLHVHPTNLGMPAITGGEMLPIGQQPPNLVEKRLGELEQQVTSISTQCTDLELQFQASLVSTYNGEFLWRIPDVSRRVRDAKTGKVTSIYSPPFFSGRMGYKMCVRAYLNGDGIGERTHLSLFFVLMRGEFDPLLSWPFKSTITLTLINQDNRSGDVREVFRTNPKSRSFQQPTSEMNVASGCPKFAGLEYLNNPSYVKQDVLYIRCTVDTSTLIHP